MLPGVWRNCRRWESQGANDVWVKAFLEFTIICHFYLFIYLFKKGIPGQLETCLCKNSIYRSDFNLVIYFALEMVSYKKYIFIVPVWQSSVNLSCWLQWKTRQNAKATIRGHWKIKADGLWKSNLDRGMKAKENHFQMKKNWEFMVSRLNSTRNEKGIAHTEGKWHQKETWVSKDEGRATNGKYLDK